MDSIRSLLQPVTHNLPQPIRNLGESIIGEACYKSLVLDVDHSDSACLKHAISKGLGYGIVGASSVVKVPQILKLVGSKSATGVSFLSYFLETAAYLVSLAYNARSGFPFSTYGETALILVQNVIISLLVLNYSSRRAAAAVFVAGLAGSATALFSPDILSAETLKMLQAGAGAVGVLSKIPQIFAIWSEGSTGQLSAFTVINYLVGSLTRIFTTLQEVDDKLILYGFLGGFALNVVLTLQIMYYWNSPAKTSANKKKQ